MSGFDATEVLNDLAVSMMRRKISRLGRTADERHPIGALIDPFTFLSRDFYRVNLPEPAGAYLWDKLDSKTHSAYQRGEIRPPGTEFGLVMETMTDFARSEVTVVLMDYGPQGQFEMRYFSKREDGAAWLMSVNRVTGRLGDEQDGQYVATTGIFEELEPHDAHRVRRNALGILSITVAIICMMARKRPKVAELVCAA